jgi:phosphoribosylformylglycinamidine cyclo-ligase
VRAFAHITGGGFVDNIPRVLPEGCDVVIRKGTWKMPALFGLIEAKGRVPESELYQVFNMGIGMVAIADERSANRILKAAREQGYKAWAIGEVTKGSGKARVV